MITPSNPVEAAPAALERLDRIVEARWCRVGGDRVDLRSHLFERRVERRPENGEARSGRTAAPRNGPVQGSRSGFVSIGELVMRALAAARLSHVGQPRCATRRDAARTEFQPPGGARIRAPPADPRSLTAGLHLLHVGVDRVDDLRVRIGFAIDDDFVEALLCASDVDRVSLQAAVPPAAVPGPRKSASSWKVLAS